MALLVTGFLFCIVVLPFVFSYLRLQGLKGLFDASFEFDYLRYETSFVVRFAFASHNVTAINRVYVRGLSGFLVVSVVDHT